MLTFFLTLAIILNPSDSLKQMIESFLNAKLNGYNRIEFEIVKAPASSDKFRLMEEETIKRKGSLAYIPFVISNPGQRERTFYSIVRVKLYKQVPVLITDLNPRTELTEAHFELQLKEVSELKGTVLSENIKPETLRTKTYIKKGTILFDEYFEIIPVIRSGDLINISSGSGNVLVSVEGTARQDGGIGDLIFVVSKNKKQFKAKVIDSNNVLIVE